METPLPQYAIQIYAGSILFMQIYTQLHWKETL